jgi:hypothetical protein
VSLASYRLLTRAVLRRCPKRSHSLFDRKESKSSPSPIGSPGHLIFVPAKQIGVESLSVIGKVDVEDHVLVFIVNGGDFAHKRFSLRVPIFQHEMTPVAGDAILP